MSTSDLVGAVTRRVERVQRDGRDARVVVAERTYNADITDVWDALTNPERIPRWFLPVTGDLTVGGRYQTEGNAGGVIERCDRPNLVAITWEFMGEVTWLELRLTAVGEETILELAHTAYVDPARWTEFGPGAVGVGWDLALYGLGAHLQTGEALDPAAAQAWALSPEGMEFITGASQSWTQAAIADGDDAETATTAGARTTAFYTGQPPAEV